MQAYGFIQLLKVPTTDYKTGLDHVYTTIDASVLAYGVLESFYSDHKPVYVTIPL